MTSALVCLGGYSEENLRECWIDPLDRRFASSRSPRWAIPRSVLQSFGPRLADLVGLSGTNPAEHEWFSGPIYAQSYLGGAGSKSKRASDQGVQFFEGGCVRGGSSVCCNKMLASLRWSQEIGVPPYP